MIVSFNKYLRLWHLYFWTSHTIAFKNVTDHSWKLNLICLYMNITYFTGWHCRLSPRGNIVDWGEAEVDNASEGWQSTMSPRNKMLYLFHYTECPISTTNFTAVRHCRVTFKIVIRQIDQSDCWKLKWDIMIYNTSGVTTVTTHFTQFKNYALWKFFFKVG